MNGSLGRAWERGVAFLRERGDCEVRSAVALLADDCAVRSAVALLADDRAAWEGRALLDAVVPVAEPTGLEAALRQLGKLDDLRALSGPAAERVGGWLARAQAADGGWAAGEPDPRRLVATGMSIGHMAKAPWARTDVLDAAAGFLAAGWTPERVKGFAWDAIAAHAAAFANFPHELSDAVLQWCGRELERGYRAGRFDAVRSLRVLLWSDAPALPGARLEVAELLTELAAAQRDDGGWLDAGAPGSARIAHSWDALVALRRFDDSGKETRC